MEAAWHGRGHGLREKRGGGIGSVEEIEIAEGRGSSSGRKELDMPTFRGVK